MERWILTKIRGLTINHPSSTYRHEVKLTDGKVGWQEWTDYGFFNENQKLMEIQSVGRNITEFKRSQDEAPACNSQREINPLLEEKEISLEIWKPNFSTICRFDREKILQVLRNTIHNGVKFSETRGRIIIGFSSLDFPMKSIAVHVIDEGSGIPPEDLDFFFYPFWQNREDYQKYRGTELGLSISHEIIKAYVGRISVSNEPENGTQIIFFFQSLKMSKGRGVRISS